MLVSSRHIARHTDLVACLAIPGYPFYGEWVYLEKRRTEAVEVQAKYVFCAIDTALSFQHRGGNAEVASAGSSGRLLPFFPLPIVYRIFCWAACALNLTADCSFIGHILGSLRY